MTIRIATLVSVFLCAVGLCAQDSIEQRVQIHGFVTQGFMFSNQNNYLDAKTNDGTAQWTDGAVTLSSSVTDKLRIGIQLHMYQLGAIGGHPDVDWASGDYQVNDHIGFRAGKIKTPLGLFNDSQDADSAHLWSLLPQSVYPADLKNNTLSSLGGEIYGNLYGGKNLGRLSYRAYDGYNVLDLSAGYGLRAKEHGLQAESGGTRVYGGDLRWHPGISGLLIGSSMLVTSGEVLGKGFRIEAKPYFMSAFYGQYEKGRFYVAAEARRQPASYQIIFPVFSLGTRADTRAWYAMTSYRTTPKLNLGMYVSRYVDRAIPAASSLHSMTDYVVSGRYDLNSFTYLKLEQHFMDGNALGFYSSVNPNGFKPRTNLFAAKIGFSF